MPLWMLRQMYYVLHFIKWHKVNVTSVISILLCVASVCHRYFVIIGLAKYQVAKLIRDQIQHGLVRPASGPPA